MHDFVIPGFIQAAAQSGGRASGLSWIKMTQIGKETPTEETNGSRTVRRVQVSIAVPFALGSRG
jgi:hypothetical protein